MCNEAVKRYQAVIFDLDGVICRTDQYHYKAWKAIADELQTPFNPTINQRLRGVGRMDSLNIILEKCPRVVDEKEKIEWATKKNTIYRSLLSAMTPEDLLPGVMTTLLQLRAQDVLLGLGSASKNAPLILHRLGLQNFLDAVIDGNDVSHSKPDPEVFAKTGSRLGVDPSACLVVEDAEAGLQAARRAGMDCAADGGSAHGSPLATWDLKSITDLVPIVMRKN